jgi:hypothetical protein
LTEQKNPATNLLIERLRERQYQQLDPVDILRQSYSLVEETLHYGSYRSFEFLVELLGDHLRLTRTSQIEAKEALEKGGLLKRYVAVARKHPWDHLGDIWTELELGKQSRLGQFLTPRPVVEMMVLMNILEEPTEPQTLLDPCVGMGRFLLGAMIKYPYAPITCYGVDIDLLMYRACLVNMKLFATLPYYIIRADSLRLDLYVNSPIWKLANTWDPAELSFAYHQPLESKPFSLTDYIRQKQEELKGE